MSGFNSCLLTCIQVSQEAGKVVWYFHFFKNFLQVCCDPHSQRLWHKVEVNVLLELSCFFDDQADVGNLISGSPAFSKTVDKTTRPFIYDLNQILYDYTLEVRNRLKGLDLIECLMNY